MKRLKDLTSNLETLKLNENEFASIWAPLTDVSATDADEVWSEIVSFTREVHYRKKSSSFVKKCLLHFLCRNFDELDTWNESIWRHIIKLATLLLEEIDVPEFEIELVNVLELFVASFAGIVHLCLSDELVLLINQNLKKHGQLFGHQFRCQFIEVLICHLQFNVNSEDRFKISANLVLDFLTNDSGVFCSESIEQIVHLVTKANSSSLQAVLNFLACVKGTPHWGSSALRFYNVLLKNLELSFLRVQFIDHYLTLIENPRIEIDITGVCDTLYKVVEKISVDQTERDIDSSICKVTLNLGKIVERVNDKAPIVTSELPEVLNILSLCLYREKQSEVKVLNQVATQLEYFFSEELAHFTLRPTGFEVLTFLEVVDVGLNFLSIKFLTEAFDFLFLCNRVLDDKWIPRYEFYLNKFGALSQNAETVELNILFRKLSEFRTNRLFILHVEEIHEVTLCCVAKVDWLALDDDHATLILTYYFDYLTYKMCDFSSFMKSFAKILESQDFSTAAPSHRILLTTFLQRTLMLSDQIIAISQHEIKSSSEEIQAISDVLLAFGHALLRLTALKFWTPDLQVKLSKFLIRSDLLKLHDAMLCMPEKNSIVSVENALTLGLKLLFNSLKEQKDYRIFEELVRSVPPFLQCQEPVERIFHRKIVEVNVIEGNDDLGTISLGRTYLEQLVIELCILIDLKPTGFKFRFFSSAETSSSYLETFGNFRSLVFQCLICLVTYPLGAKARRIVECLTSAIQDSKYGVTCLCALSVCFMECPDICIKWLPTILSNIFLVRSSRTMSVPALDLIFMLSQLPSLHHNLTNEDHKQILTIILQFVDYELYSKYCVEVALNLVCVWFLKCKVAFRVQLKKLILKELQNRIANLQKKLQYAEHLRNSSKTDQPGKANAETSTETSRDSFEAAEKLITKSDSSKSSLSEILSLQIDALEICMDVILRHVFCETLAQPKRCEISKFLLSNGVSRTWVVNNRIITITTSGNSAQLESNGLCGDCNQRANEVLKREPKPKVDRQRHKSTPQTPHAKQGLQTCERERTKLPTFLTSNEAVKHCPCWISRWAEVYVRTATGDLSYLLRTQSQGGTSSLVTSDFGLENLSSLLVGVVNSSSDYSQQSTAASSCGSTDFCGISESTEMECISTGSTFTMTTEVQRPSVSGSGGKPKVSFDFSNMLRSRSLDDIASNDIRIVRSLNSNAIYGMNQAQSQRESKEAIIKKRHASSVVATGNVAPSRIRQRIVTRGLNSSNSDLTKSSNFDFSNPSTVFYQLIGAIHQQSFEKNKGRDSNLDSKRGNSNPIFCLPDSEDLKDELNYFDNCLPFNTHKVGVLYVAEGQEFDESAVLSNICGSERYTEFIRSLGSVVTLSECNKEQKVYNAGLDKSQHERDGKLAICWIDDLFQMMFHVATLIPTPDPNDDPDCNRKKGLLGNDAVLILYNDTKTPRLSNSIIKTELNFVSIVVTPTDAKRNSVKLICKRELEPWVLHAAKEEKIISDGNLSMFVRQMALHASMACHGYLFKEKNLDYCNNWQKRLDIIRKMKIKFAAPDDLLQ